MLKVGMLSGWHVHARGYAEQILATNKAQITCVWDEQSERGEKWAADLGVDFEPDLGKFLARSDVEAVVCDAPTTIHRDVLVAAAEAGKHIFTEKALAPTVAECEEIAAAVRKSGVTFVISMPQRMDGTIQYLKKLIDRGAFGKVSLVRVRNGHNGVSGNWLPEYWYDNTKTGGGSMMDLGCHPMYCLAYLCGKPKRVSAIFNQLFDSGMDENAICTAEFENGIIGVAETSFVTYSTPGDVEVYGTEGTFLSHGGDIKVTGKFLEDFAGGYIHPGNALKGRPSPLVQFVDACIEGTGSPEGLGIEDAIDLTRLLENAYKANNGNTIVTIK